MRFSVNCMRRVGRNSRPSFARSSNPFRQVAFRARNVTKVAPATTKFPPERVCTETSCCSPRGILLFRGRRISPFTTETASRACSGVKRRLLQSIFARCTSLNASRELTKALRNLSPVSLFPFFLFMLSAFLYVSVRFQYREI